MLTGLNSKKAKCDRKKKTGLEQESNFGEKSKIILGEKSKFDQQILISRFRGKQMIIFPTVPQDCKLRKEVSVHRFDILFNQTASETLKWRIFTGFHNV